MQRVIRDGQITIPVKVRKKLGIELGDFLSMGVDMFNGTITLKKIDPEVQQRLIDKELKINQIQVQ